jgi:hypothetical protein
MKHHVSEKHSPKQATLMIATVFALGVGVCLSGVCGALAATAQSDADNLTDRTVVGVLQYTPPPEVTICFCGPFFVPTEKGEVIYLTSDTIDLFEHVHEKISVTGTPFVTGCTGTLYQPCNFVRVTSLNLVSPTPTETTTWGAIKSLFE